MVSLGPRGIWTGCVLWAIALAALPSIAQGQAHDTVEPSFEIPPAPTALPPRWFFEVHFDAIAPTVTDSICPEGAGCVYAGGGSLGTSAERRWPNGWGVYVGYDISFIDSESVFELGVQQSIRGGGRYTLPNASIVHPVVDLGVGAMVFGDTFRVATGGVVLQGLLGLEIELSRHFGVLGAVGARAFSHSSFRTERDGVSRGNGRPFSRAMLFQLALTITGRPWAAAEP